MTRPVRPLALGAILMLAGLATAPAAAASTDASTGVQETAVTFTVGYEPNGALESSLAVALAAGVVAGTAGSAYLVRRNRARSHA